MKGRMESPQASAGTVQPGFQATSTSVGVDGYRRTSECFRQTSGIMDSTAQTDYGHVTFLLAKSS